MVGLDPRSMRVVKELVKSRAAQGLTIFMSTPTLSVAEEISDRIGIVNNGKLRFLGTLAELRTELAGETTSLEELYLRLTAQ